MQKKQVLFFINTLDFGGAERVMAILLNNFSDEIDIHLALYQNIIRYPIPANIKIIDLSQPSSDSGSKILLKLPIIARKLAAYCRQNKITTTVTFLNRPSYILGMMKFFFRYRGKAIMCERSHQSSILKYIGGGSSVYRMTTKKLISFAYNQADLVITNSILSAIDLKTNFAVKSPIRTIYNPLAIASVSAQSLEPLPQPYETGSFHFVATGNFRVEKNFPLLINAFARIRHLPVKLVLVGDGALAPALKAQVAELKLTNQVIFAGFQQNPFAFIKNGDCFVLSSYTEGFPNVLLEALACGKAVVSTDCLSGPREILAPGSDVNKMLNSNYEIATHGILVAVNDETALAAAMEKIYSDDVLRERLAAAAPDRAKDFDTITILPKFREALLT